VIVSLAVNENVTVSGLVDTFSFTAKDTITSYVPLIVTPGVGDPTLIGGNDFLVQWQSPLGALADSVELFWTMDEGANWSQITDRIADSGSYLWSVPDIQVYDTRLLIRLYRNGSPVGSGMSEQTFKIEGAVPTLLSHFSGTVEKGAAMLRWKTAVEGGVSGFRVLRADRPEGIYIEISRELIKSSGAGADYLFRDADVEANKTYHYKLVEVSDDGTVVELRRVSLTFRLVFALDQNVPNPFNPETTIGFAIPEAGHVKLAIYDVAGRLVRTLVDGNRKAAYHREVWNGMDNNGTRVSSGVYFYKINAGRYVKTRKMVLLK